MFIWEIPQLITVLFSSSPPVAYPAPVHALPKVWEEPAAELVGQAGAAASIVVVVAAAAGGGNCRG